MKTNTQNVGGGAAKPENTEALRRVYGISIEDAGKMTSGHPLICEED